MAINYQNLMTYRSEPVSAGYDARQCQFYALAIGLGMDPTDKAQLGFVYERDLLPFPTMPSVLGWPGRPTDPAFGIDHRRVVAAGIRVRLHEPLATSEPELEGITKVAEVYDRGEGGHAIVAFTRDLRRPDGRVVATVDSSILARGQGGFGGQTAAPPQPFAIPQREPDISIDLPTPPNLALLFRLLGDENPLHVDPDFAAKVGFERPILHGVATFGIATHAVLKGALDYSPTSLRAIEARFVRPVYPGHTLRTEIWRERGHIGFRSTVPARGEIVLDHGLVELAS